VLVVVNDLGVRRSLYHVSLDVDARLGGAIGDRGDCILALRLEVGDDLVVKLAGTRGGDTSVDDVQRVDRRVVVGRQSDGVIERAG